MTVPPDATPVLRTHVARRTLLGRRYVLLLIRDRVFVQLGGKGVAVNRGWMTRTVCDSYAEALQTHQAMVEDYLSDGYHRVDWSDDLLPDFPDEFFDPELERLEP